MATRSTSGDSSDNPFKEALKPAAKPEDIGSIKPFARDKRQANPTKVDQTRTVADLNLIDPSALASTPKIRDLTVRDLNDLAAEFSGIPTSNARVAELTIEDIQDLEGVFLDYKIRTAREITQGRPDELRDVDVSCCSCTPCCCCAATDVSHTA